jgi:hypothetical protein
MMAGCEETMKDKDVFGRYYVTTLKFSTAADVLGTAVIGDKELVTQTSSVVASWGQEQDGQKLWFNIVAFDENKLTAARKYALMIDESTGIHVITPNRSFRFDAQSAASVRLLTEPFDNENARSIAILKALSEDFNADTGQVRLDGADLRSGVMLTKHVFATILTKLDQSPALASRLPFEGGMEFDHLNLGSGRVRMLIRDDIVTLKIKVGEDAKRFENQPDVRNM